MACLRKATLVGFHVFAAQNTFSLRLARFSSKSHACLLFLDFGVILDSVNNSEIKVYGK